MNECSHTRADGDDDDEDADGEMDETESGPTTTTSTAAAWCGRRWEAQLAAALLLTVNTDLVNQCSEFSVVVCSQYSAVLKHPWDAVQSIQFN